MRHGVVETHGNDVAKNKGAQANHSPEAGERPDTHSPSESPEGVNPAHTSIPDSWPPELTDDKIPHLFNTPRF